jgi:hypothetical protein
MSGSREGCPHGFSRLDQIIESIFLLFPEGRILSEEEVKALNIPPAEVHQEIKNARRGARRATVSAGEYEQEQETGEFFDLTRFKGLR